MPSPDTISIRAAVPARTDWASVLALVLKTFAYMIDSPFSANRQMQEAMAVQAMSGIVLLAEDATGPFGCVILNPKTDAMYLGKRPVDPSRQGEGIGCHLFEVSVEAEKAQRYAETELQARVELVENHAAFAVMGFSETGRVADNSCGRPTSVTMGSRL